MTLLAAHRPWLGRGRVALVSGATGSVGSAVVGRLLGAGCAVVACGRAMPKLEATFGATLAQLQQQGGVTHADRPHQHDHGGSRTSTPPPPVLLSLCAADFATAEGPAAYVAHAAATFGRLDAVVHCAGATQNRLFLRSSDADFAEMWNANVVSALRLTKAAMRSGGMLARKDGAFVFLSSTVAAAGNAGQVSYAASKGATEAAVRSLAREYGGSGLRFGTVAPGLIAGSAMAESVAAEHQAALVARAALGRAVSAAEVADAVLFLLQATGCTGQTIHVDGGSVM